MFIVQIRKVRFREGPGLPKVTEWNRWRTEIKIQFPVFCIELHIKITYCFYECRVLVEDGREAGKGKGKFITGVQ